MSFNLNLTDGKSHEVSLYAVDWDNSGRSEQVQVIDAATGTVLTRETLSSFQGGEYLSWNLSGNVVIKVTNLNPSANAVDQRPLLRRQADRHQRHLPGHGHDDPGQLARGLRGRRLRHRRRHQRRQPQAPLLRHPEPHRRLDLHLGRQAPPTPAPCRTRPTPAGSPRPGTPATTMSFNLNLTDGQAHKVSLYAVDCDNHGRSEQVQVIDAATGTVLTRRRSARSQGGEYLSWNLSGNVVIKVTNLNPKTNAVVSGLFFD